MENIDSLLRNLDNLGVVDEIPDFCVAIKFNNIQQILPFRNLGNKFTRDLEYSAALDFNDNSKRKIIMAQLHQEFHTRLQSKGNPYDYKIFRKVSGWILFNDGKILALETLGPDTMLLKFSYNKPYEAIGDTTIFNEEINNSSLPLVKIMTEKALEWIKNFWEGPEESRPETHKFLYD